MSDVRDIKKGDRMSPREDEVFRYLAAGLMNKQIAWELGIGEATVKALVSAVLRKTGAVSRSQVVLIALGLDVGAEVEKARAARVVRPSMPVNLPAPVVARADAELLAIAEKLCERFGVETLADLLKLAPGSIAARKVSSARRSRGPHAARGSVDMRQLYLFDDLAPRPFEVRRALA